MPPEIRWAGYSEWVYSSAGLLEEGWLLKRYKVKNFDSQELCKLQLRFVLPK